MTRFAFLSNRTSVVLLAFCMALIAGCGGTKVYTVDKTITYRDAMYNMSNVQKISGREEAKLADGTVVNLRNKDKKEVEKFFKENDEVLVSMIVDMDQQEMVYLRMNVEKYSDYKRLKSRFDKALKDISKFMADKKDTQLNLK
jgi:hypothetical protein